MPTPFKHQIEGAIFLAGRSVRMLADEQRVGKTGASIMACDYIFARRVLVVTKSSARANWGRDFREWQAFPRTVQVIYAGSEKIDPAADVVVVGWAMVNNLSVKKQLLASRRDVLILDEIHEAKNPHSGRSKAVFGTQLDDGAILYKREALSNHSRVVWPLSGTGIPNTPIDLHAMLRAIAPERLLADVRGWPDVTKHSAFLHRYCVTRKKYVGGQWIEFAIKGRNEDELRERMKGFWLRRTQAEVGIMPPVFNILALHAERIPTELLSLDEAAVLNAAETGERVEEMHLGVIRRVTGMLKANAVIEFVRDELDDGLDKIVLMAWHTDVIDALRAGLAQYGVVGIDGRTPATHRQAEENAFRDDTTKRVFVGQIQAAGEAIDLSASAVLYFVEVSFVPKDMAQAAMRITNHTQKRQPHVRVCALAGSIDEALMSILTRKVESITKIMEN